MSKGKIPISEGKRLATQYRAPMVIVFSLHDNGDTFNVMSYGMNRKLCRHAADIATKIAEKVLDSTIAPAQQEPFSLPDQPAQWEKTQCTQSPPNED